jgi:hypothetical protein
MPVPPPREERWLAWYLRALATVFLIAGLLQWQSILGTPGFVAISDMPIYRQILTGYLGIVMLVAAVGLWMVASWGTVVWMLAALSEIVAHVAFRDLYGPAWGVVGFHLTAMVIYVVLAWRVAQVREE